MSERTGDTAHSIDPDVLRGISRLLRKARREHGLAHAATMLRAAIREARGERQQKQHLEQR